MNNQHLCPACGTHIPVRQEIPFITRSAWRERVAEILGYESDFIKNLSKYTRIHKHHFAEHNIRDNKPIGLPEFEIVKIDGWPLRDINVGVEKNHNAEIENFNIDIEAFDDEVEEIIQETEPLCVIVEYKQLKLLLRQCYYCGHNINEDSLCCKKRGGIVFAKYWCYTCRSYRLWRSFKQPLTQLITGASMLSGVGLAKVLHFFTILQCLIPVERNCYYAAKRAIRPAVEYFYKIQQENLINLLKHTNGVHISCDGQYDSPGRCAYYCTVSALESTTRKIIGFCTTTQKEADNKSSNAEPIATRRLLNELLTKINILSVTTDNSSSLNRLFKTEFPQIRHYLDLWHILRNMFKKFAPIFRTNQLCKQTFGRLTRFIWKVGAARREDKSDEIFIQKILSVLFHFAGIHCWPQGRFVDLFNNLVMPYVFPPGLVHEIWMTEMLHCNHNKLENEEIIDINDRSYQAILRDICSDNRIMQLKRATWYFDIRSMIAILHHNNNIEAENRGERVVTRVQNRIGKTTNEPASRIHKTLIFDWQKNIMNFIRKNEHSHIISEEDLNELEIDFQDLHVQDNNLNDEIINDENTEEIDDHWELFFQHNVNID